MLVVVVRDHVEHEDTGDLRFRQGDSAALAFERQIAFHDSLRQMARSEAVRRELFPGEMNQPDVARQPAFAAQVEKDRCRQQECGGRGVIVVRAASGEPRPAEGMISFEGGGRRLTARLIAGEFIRYRSRFPAEFGCRAEVLAGPFTEAVRRVSLVAERASPVRLAFGSGVVVVEAQAEGRARAVETVAADFEGDEPVISFNPHYLLDGLGAVAVEATARAVAPPGDGNSEAASASSGRIRIEFTSPAKPALITWANDAKPAAGEQNGSADGERPDPADGERPDPADGGRPDPADGGRPDPADGGRPDPADGGRPDPADGIPGAAGGRSGVPAFRYLVVPLRVPART